MRRLGYYYHDSFGRIFGKDTGCPGLSSSSHFIFSNQTVNDRISVRVGNSTWGVWIIGMYIHEHR